MVWIRRSGESRNLGAALDYGFPWNDGKIGMVWIRRSGEKWSSSWRVDSGFRRNDGKVGMTGKPG